MDIIIKIKIKKKKKQALNWGTRGRLGPRIRVRVPFSCLEHIVIHSLNRCSESLLSTQGQADLTYCVDKQSGIQVGAVSKNWEPALPVIQLLNKPSHIQG